MCLSVHWRMFPKQGSALCHAQPDPGHRSCLPYGSPPQVLTPQADGTKTFTTDTAVIDISHTQEGYIMAKYTGSNAKPKLQLTGTDGITYTYSLYKDYSTFPLTSGDGTYQVGVYENVSDDRYTTLLSETFSVTLTDPLKPYLYPNQYVNFTADFLPVAKAEELADGASSDLDIISSVYNYIITHTTRTLLHISTILNHYMLGFIIAFLVLLIICMILYHTDLGRVLFLGQKLAMTVASGRVPNCLYLVLSSGLDSNIGLTLARELVNNPHMQALIDKCHENIRHGESFDKALLLSGIFSQMYASWIVIGSRTGEMESIVSQREINTDTASYLTALRAALRQINGIIYTSAAENMIAMDSSILQLYKDGRIDKHTAISEAVNPEIMSKRLNLL
ncbi:MAG TPA: hypothetical protein DC452_04460 [Roseburia sp.]|nr:hypothetical protein [Roseburia sp.]